MKRNVLVKSFMSLFIIISLMFSSIIFANAENNTSINISANQIDNTKAIKISWDSMENAKTYNVYRMPYDAFIDIDYSNFTKIATVNSSQNSFIDINLDWYDSYYYAVSYTIDETEIYISVPVEGYVINPSPEFSSIDDIDEIVNKIYKANEYDIIKTASNKNDDTVDEHYTYYEGSCGPTSRYFQKVLYDNNICSEIRLKSPDTDTHSYNLIRASFDNGETVTNVIIDPTYIQTLRFCVGSKLGISDDHEIDLAIDKIGLPDINVFEHGDLDALKERINSYLLPAGYDNWNLDSTSFFYENRVYPEVEMQMFYNTYMTFPQMDNIHSMGKLNNPFENDLFLKNTATNSTNKLNYLGNGIYECLLKNKDQTESDGKFIVCDENNNSIYGASDESCYITPYQSFDFNYMYQKPETFLTKNSIIPFTINLSASSYCDGTLVRIDLRSGIDNPIIVTLQSGDYLIGDADNNKSVNICDVTLIQKYISNQYTPTGFQINFAAIGDVNLDGNVSINDATCMQKQLASIEFLESIGKEFYTSPALRNNTQNQRWL